MPHKPFHNMPDKTVIDMPPKEVATSILEETIELLEGLGITGLSIAEVRAMHRKLNNFSYWKTDETAAKWILGCLRWYNMNKGS